MQKCSVRKWCLDQTIVALLSNLAHRLWWSPMMGDLFCAYVFSVATYVSFYTVIDMLFYNYMQNGTNETRSQKKSAGKLGVILNIFSAIFAIINGLIILPIIIVCLEHNTAVLGWYWPVFLLVIFSILSVPVLLVIGERVIERLKATLTEEQPATS